MRTFSFPGVFWSALLLAVAGVLVDQLGTPYAMMAAVILSAVAKALDIYMESGADQETRGMIERPGPLSRWLFG